MAGGGHGAAFPPVPGRVYTVLGKAMGAVMWFWILHRAKEDGGALLVRTRARVQNWYGGKNGLTGMCTRGAQGFRHPWEHAHHGPGHGGAHH
jgi:hypothetical protein